MSTGAAEWPQYDSVNDKFMELNKNLQIITTPNKEKLEGLIENIFSARREQAAVDSPSQGIHNMKILKS